MPAELLLEKTAADGKHLGGHSSHGKALADVKGGYCCPTHHQGVMSKLKKLNK